MNKIIKIESTSRNFADRSKSILLISPCSEEWMAEKYFMSPAPGVVRLAAYLNSCGFYAEWFDPNFSIVTKSGETLLDKLNERSWDFVGFSVLDETLPTDIENMYLVKELLPNCTLVVGGIEAQFNYQEILDKSPAKIVVTGEGELVLEMLMSGKPLHDIPGIIFKSFSKPLSQEKFNEATLSIPWEDIPYERYWDFYVKKYGTKITPTNIEEIHTVRVFSRNRCPIGCKFCSSTNQLTWGSGGKVPVLSVTEENVIHVVKRIIESHPRTKTVYLTDDDFAINKRSVIRFCELVIKENLHTHVTFMCFARASDLDEEVVGWMKSANFRRLVIGVESFSQRLLDNMNKRCTEDQIHNGLKVLTSFGIKPHINLILIFPDSRIEDIESSVYWGLHYITEGTVFCGVIASIRPLKGTDYFEEYFNYNTEIRSLSNTGKKIKINSFIWADDPVVREVQIKYWENIDNEIAGYVENAGVVHSTGDNVSLVSLFFMKSLLDEIKLKHNIETSVEQYSNIFTPVIKQKYESWIISRSKPRKQLQKTGFGRF